MLWLKKRLKKQSCTSDKYNHGVEIISKGYVVIISQAKDGEKLIIKTNNKQQLPLRKMLHIPRPRKHPIILKYTTINTRYINCASVYSLGSPERYADEPTRDR
jgi:hypothetical protein